MRATSSSSSTFSSSDLIWFVLVVVCCLVSVVTCSNHNNHGCGGCGCAFVNPLRYDADTITTTPLSERRRLISIQQHHHHRQQQQQYYRNNKNNNNKFQLYAVQPSQDNLIAGISEIGIGFSLGVLWSEYSIIITGCGPINFSDTLERICYQGVIIYAGIALFNRIVTDGNSLVNTCEEYFGQSSLNSFTLFQVRVVEFVSTLAVIGAFVALGYQYSHGEQMDGLSGINISMCRAMRDMM